jgi:hypothetical protein
MIGADIKKLLQHYERNIIPLSREGEYRTQFPVQKKFLFLYFLIKNPPVYPPFYGVYTLYLQSYPQFKKVFTHFHFKIHTICAERFKHKNFAGKMRTQDELSYPNLFSSTKNKKPATTAG